ncbi:hypothetical protein FHT86_007666 [Rhizobium sp. BK313]|nr:hypothetical protein [Rhizobium sp. BK313]
MSIDKPMSPSNRRSQHLSMRTSFRQMSPNSFLPSIVIVHSAAMALSPNKAMTMDCSGLTIRIRPQKNYRKAAPDEPACDAVQQNPVRAVGKGGARARQVREHNMRQPIGNFDMSFRVLQDNVQKTQRPLQRLVEGLGMQHTMAEQREAAAPHRSAAHAKEFVFYLGRDRKPERTVAFRGDRRVDPGDRPSAVSARSGDFPCRRRQSIASFTKKADIIRRPASVIVIPCEVW